MVTGPPKTSLGVHDHLNLQLVTVKDSMVFRIVYGPVGLRGLMYFTFFYVIPNVTIIFQIFL